jgi:all-trans-retinol 13,14-reductase
VAGLFDPYPRAMAERPWSHDIPDGPWDAVVIGSGMGGMAAAATLAKLGKRVLVLEQHNIPGGFTQTFKRPGFRWDVGVHIVGEMSDASYPGRLLGDLTEGRLAWASVGDVYDEFHFPDGFVIQFPNSREAFRDRLVEAFPDEVDAIDEYLGLVRQAARASAGWLQQRAVPRWLSPGKRKAMAAAEPHWRVTTAEVLAGLTEDPRLQTVLAAQWGYYGDPPSRSSFAMHALMVAHFMKGAYYPVGTAQSIAPALLETVAGAGGWTAVRRRVAEIVVDGGRVRGVRLEDGTMIDTKVVLSAAGAVQTARLAGESWEPGFAEPGPAHLSLYLGFEGVDAEAVGATRQCQWFYEKWDLEAELWDVSPDGTPGRAPVLFTSFPSTKDPDHEPGPERRHTGEVITFVPWDAFSRWEDTRWRKRPDDYESFKQALADQLLAQFAEHFPDLAPHVVHAELSTPVSTAHFTEALEGSIYGLATEPDRFLAGGLDPRTTVKGLYLAGQDTGTPGITGALIGGVLGAAAVEPFGAGRYLQGVMRSMRS